jgi:hypothetical protein
MKTFMWNIPEFDLSRNLTGITLRVINPRFSASYALLLSAFFEGALETLGHSVTTREVSNGSIRLIAVKK